MAALIMGFSIALPGLVAGLYLGTSIQDRRVADLSAGEWLAMHTMRDRTFRRVMPVLSLVTLAVVVAATALAIHPGWPRALAALAIGLMLADISIAVLRQVPANRRIDGWTAASMPPDWTRTRDRWRHAHDLRTTIGLTANSCLLLAVFMTNCAA